MLSNQLSPIFFNSLNKRLCLIFNTISFPITENYWVFFSNFAKEVSTFSFLFELLELIFDHPKCSIFSFQSTSVAHQQLIS